MPSSPICLSINSHVNKLLRLTCNYTFSCDFLVLIVIFKFYRFDYVNDTCIVLHLFLMAWASFSLTEKKTSLLAIFFSLFCLISQRLRNLMFILYFSLSLSVFVCLCLSSRLSLFVSIYLTNQEPRGLGWSLSLRTNQSVRISSEPYPFSSCFHCSSVALPPLKPSVYTWTYQQSVRVNLSRKMHEPSPTAKWKEKIQPPVRLSQWAKCFAKWPRRDARPIPMIQLHSRLLQRSPKYLRAISIHFLVGKKSRTVLKQQTR